VGVTRLDAMVEPDNDPAVSFWEAVGFERNADGRWSLLV